MLPFEAHLLAAGWPRWRAAEEGEDGSEGARVMEREGSRGARMLFQARRCACLGPEERRLLAHCSGIRGWPAGAVACPGASSRLWPACCTARTTASPCCRP
jgi:hypothetical protein